MDSKYLRTYAALVVSNADPLLVGRVQVRIPLLHGVGANEGLIADNDLPWALPSGLAAGASNESGGISWIPVSGDQVWVNFLDEEPEKVVWTWGNQTTPAAKSLGNRPLHAYEKGVPVRRGALTRYGHWLEFLPNAVDMWTKSGYHVTAHDGTGSGEDGRVFLKTAKGYSLVVDDDGDIMVGYAPSVQFNGKRFSATFAETLDLTAETINLTAGTLNFSGEYSDFTLDFTGAERGLALKTTSLAQSASVAAYHSTPKFYVTDMDVALQGASRVPTAADYGFSVVGGKVTLGKGADDPVVRLSDLKAAFEALKAQYDAHVHGDSPVPSQPLDMSVSGSAKVVVESSSSKQEKVA